MDRYKVGFVVTGGLMTIIFLIIVNLLTSPNHLWFIYPAFALLLSYINIIFGGKRKYKEESIFSSILIIVFLVGINYLHTPYYPWFVYAIFPVIWWPIAIFSGKKAGTVGFALIASISTIVYYSLLNILLSPGYPWAIYPAYAVLWWPIALFFSRRKDFFGLSITGSLLSILFFITVNVVSSPSTIWAVYPIFGILWWPLSMYYFYYKRRKKENTANR